MFGRAAAQIRAWVKRLRDAVEERRAKAGELAHRQAREDAVREMPQTDSSAAAERDGFPAAVSARDDGSTHRGPSGNGEGDAPAGTPAEIAAESVPPVSPPAESDQQPSPRRGGRRRKGTKAGQVVGQ